MDEQDDSMGTHALLSCASGVALMLVMVTVTIVVVAAIAAGIA
jgi:hypothetical protein